LHAGGFMPLACSGGKLTCRPNHIRWAIARAERVRDFALHPG
jgi:hypothetical protein